MKTFEQLLKIKIKEDLQVLTETLKIIVINDVSLNINQKDTDIIVLIRTGAGQRLALEGVDATSTNVQINFILHENILQNWLREINQYINSVNGLSNILKDEESGQNYTYSINFNTPIAGTSGKSRFVQINLLGDAVYGTDLVIGNDTIYQFTYTDLNNELQTNVLGGVLNTSRTVGIQLSSSGIIGNNIAKTEQTVGTASISFSCLYIKNNELHKFLNKLFEELELSKVEIKIKRIESNNHYQYQQKTYKIDNIIFNEQNSVATTFMISLVRDGIE